MPLCYFGSLRGHWGAQCVQRGSSGDLVCPFTAYLVILEVSYGIRFGIKHPLNTYSRKNSPNWFEAFGDLVGAPKIALLEQIKPVWIGTEEFFWDNSMWGLYYIKCLISVVATHMGLFLISGNKVVHFRLSDDIFGGQNTCFRIRKGSILKSTILLALRSVGIAQKRG